MWQGKSMIPKPRLSTPRRADLTRTTNHAGHTPSRNPRTPSRLPRPPTRYTEEPPNTPITTNPVLPVYNRGDALAERVIATGVISYTSKLDSLYNTPTNKSRFSLPQSISNCAERASDIQNTPSTMINSHLTPSNMPPSTPPRTPKSHTENAFTTPEKYSTSSRVPSNSSEELIIDEELVTRTPAKHKNAEWLASFGIDISLLKITDDEENQHPNLTPLRDTYQTPCSGEHRPTSSNSKPNAFQRRRATDFYGYAQSADTLPNRPTRIASARKSRRASARISVRELDALNFRPEEPSIGPAATTGSDVFLTPVRASRKQREKNGTPVVLSEVRRSLRINTPSKELVPKNSVRGRIELLEANDHSYIPNPCLSDRSFSG